MKKTFKKMTVVLGLVAAAGAMTACGGSSESTTSAPAAQTEAAPAVTDTPATEAPAAGVTIAKTETWGDYTVGVPEGWEFRKGDTLDENDTHYCSVKKGSFSYFDFKMEDEKTMERQYNYNKKTYTNDQTDVSGKYGDIDWTGFQYSDGWGGYGIELYSTVNGKPVRVSATFKFDSEEVKTVLESLKIK